MQYNQFNPSCPVIVGCGAVSVLGDKIKEYGCKKPVVVCDPGIEAAGITAKVVTILKDSGLDCAVFAGVHADPSAEIADAAYEVAAAFGADCLVGLGGGSSIDTAKAASIRLSGFEGLTRDYVLGHPIKVDTTNPLFLVPTTTGTGSEVTKVAVISRPELKVKWSVYVNTTMAIVDPELTVTLPQHETATTGLDALAHATEALTSNAPNLMSDYMAKGAIKKIAESLVTTWKEPNNLEARSDMAIAATWAGIAFADPLTHLGHSIGDALGCNYHTAHGHSCSLGLPEVMRLIAPAVPDKMAIIAKAMGIKLNGDESGNKLGDIVADFIYDLMRQMEFKSLASMDLTREQVVSLAQEVVDNHLTSYCPVEMNLENTQELLGKVYDNYK